MVKAEYGHFSHQVLHIFLFSNNKPETYVIRNVINLETLPSRDPAADKPLSSANNQV